MTDTIKKRIREFVLSNYLFTNDPSALHDDESFMKRGIIDSTGVLEVIQFLNDEFGVTVTDEEMGPENLDSVISLAGFIQSKDAKTKALSA